MLKGSPSIRLIWAGIGLNVAITTFHGLAWWLAPFGSDYPEAPAWIGILVFQCTVLVTLLAAVLAPRSRHQEKYSQIARDWVLALSETKTSWMLIVSCIGVALHLVAKAPLIEVAQEGGLGQLRGEWVLHDHANDPIWIRTASMFGFLGSHFAMPGLLITAFRITYGRCNWRTWLLFILFATVMILFAGAIVSRTVVVTVIVVVLLGVILAVVANPSTISRVRRLGLTTLVVVLSIAATFNWLVFTSKIENASESALIYVEANLVDAAATWRTDDIEAWVTLCPICLPTLHYLNHGIWNYAQLLDTKQRGDPVLLSFLGYYLDRLELVTPHSGSQRVYSLGGPTLPGAAYHDYGWFGVLITAWVLAACWLLAIALICRSSGYYLWPGLTLLVATGLTMAMSLLFVAPATLSFPFVIFAFLVCAFADRRSAHRFRSRNVVSSAQRS